ncbi:MAG: hypothetical protein AB4372_29980 [Xenococcus sp. (in: cyanobacteria)]
MSNWDQIENGSRIEIGLLQVDIAGHSSFQDSDRILHETKELFRKHSEGIAKIRNGKLFNYAGDGGSFMFLTGKGEGFEDLVFSAIQILKSISAVNEEAAIKTGFSDILSLRISCDSGTVVYNENPQVITADFVNRFLKNERKISLRNTVSITERVWLGC